MLIYAGLGVIVASALALTKVIFDMVVYAAAVHSFHRNRQYVRMHEHDHDLARKIMRLNGTLVDYDAKSRWQRFISMPPIELAVFDPRQ
jgi:hypothetical protein